MLPSIQYVHSTPNVLIHSPVLSSPKKVLFFIFG
jgi:hypothetical protein